MKYYNPYAAEIRIRDDHALPTIRIYKLVIEHFKSVEYGEVEFACAKRFVPYGTQSDILGMYGQNGSGKTAFIEALDIVRLALRGARIPASYAESVRAGCAHARIEATFDLQYEDGRIRKVIYSCRLKRTENREEADADGSHEVSGVSGRKRPPYRLQIIEEDVSASGVFEGRKIKLQTIITTACEDAVFGPASKRKYYIGKNKKLLMQLEGQKVIADRRSTSFLFSGAVLDAFAKNSEYSEFCQILLELNLYATRYLAVVGTKASGLIRLNVSLPFVNRSGQILMSTDKGMVVPQEFIGGMQRRMQGISDVLAQIVPGAEFKLKVLSQTLTENGKQGFQVELVSVRDGVEMPIRTESDGIRRLISVLELIIEVMNEPSVTVVIDEFDAGIYEYLLGEILESIQDYGKGQFIFTSHNLRPLEVLDKNFICFTTTNPQNRYFRMTHIGNTNNLRDIYYREILLGEQDEEVYSMTKRHRIVQAMRKAGE